MPLTEEIVDLFEEIIAFVRVHGPEAHYASDEVFRKQLVWHSSHDRMDIIRDRGMLTGVFLWMTLTKTGIEDLKQNRFPTDSPRGEYLYVPVAVMHPLYRHLPILQRLLSQKRVEFPSLRFIFYYSADRGHRPTLLKLSQVQEAIA